MKPIVILLIAACCALGACTLNQKYHKPGGTEDELQQDFADCQALMKKRHPVEDADYHDQLDRCMVEKGYFSA